MSSHPLVWTRGGGLVVIMALIMVLGGCIHTREEPGLFGRAEEPTAGPTEPVLRGSPDNLNLPVVGETLWTSTEGLALTVRIAVHAVRRIEGATVLDWSVTPLSAPSARFGDELPRSVELGLNDEAQSTVTIVLLDPGDDVAYRPLSHHSRQVFNHCLCTPVWLAQQSLRIGETVLLQIAYPVLPRSLREVDVAFSTVAPVFGVPVTPLGQVPKPTTPVDLARAAPIHRPGTHPIRFDTKNPDRRQTIALKRVVRGQQITALEWTIRSVNDQANFRGSPFGEPISATTPPDVYALGFRVASGPQLLPAGKRSTRLTALWMTAQINGQEWFECLCTSLGLWAPAVARAGGSVQVVTLYPALPTQDDQVDVVLPGLATVSVPVEAAVPGDSRLGPPVTRDVGRWTYPENPPLPWATQDWPTPVPAAAQLADYLPAVESIRPLPVR